MPLTAYSSRFAIEMDVGQWLSRIDGRPLGSFDLTSIDARLRQPAFGDLQCPSCEARGAVLVSAGVGRGGRVVSQATFRFQDSLGGDAHDPLCDFAGHANKPTAEAGLIDLRSARDSITVLVRRLVCAGLETGAFSPADMRAMRLWFLGRRRDARVRLRLDPRIPPIVRRLLRKNHEKSVVPFQPMHGDIPGFDWSAAAAERVLKPFQPLLDTLVEARIWPNEDAIAQAVRLLQQGGDVEVFDASTLASHFQTATQLVRFIAEEYGPIRNAKQRWYNESYQEPRPALLALAALLLFVSDWDLSRAADRFARLASQKPSDEAAGNLIGLNPFTHWHPVRLIKALQESEVTIDPTFDLDAAIQIDIERLKREHAAWVQLNERLKVIAPSP